jgi:hypothetical protein
MVTYRRAFRCAFKPTPVQRRALRAILPSTPPLEACCWPPLEQGIDRYRRDTAGPPPGARAKHLNKTAKHLRAAVRELKKVGSTEATIPSIMIPEFLCWDKQLCGFALEARDSEASSHLARHLGRRWAHPTHKLLDGALRFYVDWGGKPKFSQPTPPREGPPYGEVITYLESVVSG